MKCFNPSKWFTIDSGRFSLDCWFFYPINGSLIGEDGSCKINETVLIVSEG